MRRISLAAFLLFAISTSILGSAIQHARSSRGLPYAKKALCRAMIRSIQRIS
jgi:hypothetical protein